jgi:FkbM family methyltransferase
MVERMEGIKIMYSLDQVLGIHGLRPKTVLHVGAHIGQELGLYKNFGIESGIFIEADPETYQRLEQSLINENSWHSVEALVSDIGEVDIDFWRSSNDKMSSSLLKPGMHLTEHPDVKFEKDPITIKTKTLDSLNLGKFDLVVMDVQGAELKVLRGGIETFKNADALWLEVALGGLYQGDCTINDLVEFLSKFDFYPAYVVIGSTLWGDAFFVKRSTLINKRENQ